MTLPPPPAPPHLVLPGAPTATSDGPPPAPGAIGEAIPSKEILAYLSAVMRWRDDVRATLDKLDGRVRRSSHAAALTADLTLGFAVWQSISTRVDEIGTAWDSGRVGRKEREQISTLIWGRLDGGLGGGFSVSFVESCVLAEALIGQLRSRLDADAMAGGVGERIDALRAQLARCRALAEMISLSTESIDETAARIDVIVARVSDGEAVEADVRHLEAVADGLERDFLIAGATQRGIVRDLASMRDRLAAVTQLEATARDDAAWCAEKIASPPRLAVPSAATLGPLPTDAPDPATLRAALDAFDDKLTRVERAMAEAARRFAEPRAKRGDLRGLLESYQAMAGGRGHAEDATLAAAFGEAKELLWSAPCDLVRAQTLVTEYQRLVRLAAVPRPTATPAAAPVADIPGDVPPDVPADVPPPVDAAPPVDDVAPEPTAADVAPEPAPQPAAEPAGEPAEAEAPEQES